MTQGTDGFEMVLPAVPAKRYSRETSLVKEKLHRKRVVLRVRFVILNFIIRFAMLGLNGLEDEVSYHLIKQLTPERLVKHNGVPRSSSIH